MKNCADGDGELRRLPSHRTQFLTGGTTFLGSAWEGAFFPPHLTGVVPSEGVFIEGIWSVVVDALRDGRVGDVAEIEVMERCSRDGEFVYVVVDDARAYAWAPIVGQLARMP